MTQTETNTNVVEGAEFYNLEPHRLAKLTPLMTDAELQGLEADILERGIREPIIIFEGKNLEGRHRQKIAKKHGLPLPAREFKGTPADALREVVSYNVMRRHLTVKDRARVAALASNYGLGSNRYKAQSPDGATFSMSTAEAAERFKVGSATIERYRAIIAANDPELLAQVESGEIPIAKGAEIAKKKQRNNSDGAKVVNAIIANDRKIIRAGGIPALCDKVNAKEMSLEQALVMPQFSQTEQDRMIGLPHDELEAQIAAVTENKKKLETEERERIKTEARALVKPALLRFLKAEAKVYDEAIYILSELRSVERFDGNKWSDEEIVETCRDVEVLAGYTPEELAGIFGAGRDKGVLAKLIGEARVKQQ